MRYAYQGGKSTLQAIKKVEHRAKWQRVQGREERWYTLLTLDIKNSFNSMSWKTISKEAVSRRMPIYFSNIIKDYLNNRTRVYGNKAKTLSAGVPRG